MSRHCQCDTPITSPDGRFYLDILICGRRIKALVDTGSPLTYIGDEVRRLLEAHRVTPHNHKRTVRLADGTCISSIKIFPVVVTANGKTTQLLASALRTLAEPVILGMDFLRQRQASLTIDGIKLEVPVFCAENPLTVNNYVLKEGHHKPENSRHTVIKTEIDQKIKRRSKAKRNEQSGTPIHIPTVVAKNEKGYRRKGQHKSLFNIKMERNQTRPATLGNTKPILRQTRTPRQVPAYVPPFEARPVMHSVEQSEVAKSGEVVIDKVPKTFWEAKKEPLHTTANGPPPLAPLLNTIPPDLGEDDESEDLFKGIIVRPPKTGGRGQWMVYPKGRPKVEVTVRDRMVRLRCKGKEKTFCLEDDTFPRKGSAYRKIKTLSQ